MTQKTTCTKNNHYNWMCQRNDFEYIAMVSIKTGYVMSTYQSSKLGLKQKVTCSAIKSKFNLFLLFFNLDINGNDFNNLNPCRLISFQLNQRDFQSGVN